MVSGIARSLTREQATKVAEVCLGLPLLLNVVANALGTGRVDMGDVHEAMATAGAGQGHVVGDKSSSKALNSHGHQALQTAGLSLVLLALHRDQQVQLLQLTVFPSGFDQEAAQVVLDVEQAYSTRTVLQALYRHSLIAYNATAASQQYNIHMAVRQEVVALQFRRGPALLAEAKQRYLLHVLALMAGWARMAGEGQSVHVALSLARAQQADIDALMVLLADPAVLTLRTAKAVAACLTKQLVNGLLGPLGMLTSSSTLLAMKSVLERITGEGSGSSDEDKLLQSNAKSAMGVVERSRGRYAAAYRLHDKALHLRTEVLGERHPDTINSVNDMATCISGRRDYSQARPLYEKALLLYTEELGEEHPYTIGALNNLANCISGLGDDTKAQELYEKALQLRTKVLGERHPDTIRTIKNLASCIFDQKNYTQARPMFERALQLRTEVLGERHPDTIRSVKNLANCISDQGDYSQAQTLFEKVLRLRTEVLGEQHPDTISSVKDLADCMSAQGV